MTLGSFFKIARKAKGKTLKDIAEAIGASTNQIWKLEQGNAGMALFDKACDAISLDWTRLPDAPSLGLRLRALRRAKGYTQEALAASCGLPAATISRVEANRGHLRSVEKIFFHLSPDSRVLRQRAIHKRRTSDIAFTSPDLLLQIEHVLGGQIDLDPCSDPHDHVNAKRSYGIETDGLLQDWKGKTVFVNPPYSRASKWLRKGLAVHRADPAKIILFLVPARSQTKVWRDISPYCDILLLTGRLHFWNNSGPHQYGAPHSSAIIIFGATTDLIERARQVWKFIYIRRTEHQNVDLTA